MADSQPNRNGYELLPGTDLMLPSFEALPSRGTCIYFLLRFGLVYWVGRTTSLHSRLGGHRSEGREWDACLYYRCPQKLLSPLEAMWTARLQPVGAHLSTIVAAKAFDPERYARQHGIAIEELAVAYR